MADNRKEIIVTIAVSSLTTIVATRFREPAESRFWEGWCLLYSAPFVIGVIMSTFAYAAA